MVDLALILATGFLGSAHCIGMCGPLVASCSRAGGFSGSMGRQLTFHAGRGIGYSLLGALVGFLGAAVDLGSRLASLPAIAGTLAGLAMCLLALEQLRLLSPLGLRFPLLQPIGRLLASASPWAPLPAGIALGLMPCGLLYAAAAYAAAAGPLRGALVMVAFWLGNLLPLLALGSASQFAWGKMRGRATQLAAIAMLGLGLYTTLDRSFFLPKAAHGAACHEVGR